MIHNMECELRSRVEILIYRGIVLGVFIIALVGCASSPPQAHTEIVGGKSEITSNHESHGQSTKTIDVVPMTRTITVDIQPSAPKEPK